ncbi:hypothetical protein D3C77_520280 [compost metagenome]
MGASSARGANDGDPSELLQSMLLHSLQVSGKMEGDVARLVPGHFKTILLLDDLRKPKGNDEDIGIFAIHVLHQRILKLEIIVQPVQEREHVHQQCFAKLIILIETR